MVKEVTQEQYREPICNNEDVIKNIRPQKIKKENKREI